MNKKIFNSILKFSALLFPFYFVFYGPLYDNPGNSNIKALWKFMFLGFLAYLILALLFITGIF
jgi:hypothetical protein